MPNKLRVQYPRRPCPRCAEPDPPHADFPDGWGGGSDLLHIDIKVPSEHTLEGKQFAGEYQMFHLHPYRGRSPAISVFFDYDEDTPTNEHFQQLLNRFWITFNRHKGMCQKTLKNDPGRKLRGDRNTDEEEQEDVHQAVTDKRSLKKQVENGLTSLWSKFQWISKSIEGEQKDLYEVGTDNRELQPKQVGNSTTTKDAWNPYAWGSIINTLYFYGYKGSTTEPPCKSFSIYLFLKIVTTNKPSMGISLKQNKC
jgi:hypothetical protein